MYSYKYKALLEYFIKAHKASLRCFINFVRQYVAPVSKLMAVLDETEWGITFYGEFCFECF